MRRIDRWIFTALCFSVLVLLPASGLADDKADLYDCGKRSCSEWAEKGDKMCRTCKAPQCRKEGDKELLVGEKKENECYTGGGAPPPDEDE